MDDKEIIMEKRLQELGEEANNLEECLKDAENERDAALAEIARLRAIPDLIRKRYPRMLERGNPLYDGVLAAMMERCDEQPARLRAQLEGAVVVPRDCGTCGSYQDIGGEPRRCEGCSDSCDKWHPSRSLSAIHSVPASRVLRDGEVAVREELVSAYEDLYTKTILFGFEGDLIDRIAALRSQEGGA